MFSQTVEYALRAVVHLASEAPSPRTTEEIAKATKVPAAYLAKVIQNLVQTGVLRSQRGNNTVQIIWSNFGVTVDPNDVITKGGGN